jgi:bacterioferritin-associated ferredoxin
MSCDKKACCQSTVKEPDYLICTCMGVMMSEIVTAIHGGADSFKKLADQLGVGTGCSSCVAEVNDLLEKNKK